MLPYNFDDETYADEESQYNICIEMVDEKTSFKADCRFFELKYLKDVYLK